MMPRLRDIARLTVPELYPLNEIPDEIVRKIGRNLVYLLCIGRKDISGNDWGDVFAEAIGGEHLGSPVGIADVVYGKQAWSVKTVKNTNPFVARSLRLISGRCSPDYSYNITDPHADITATGRAVLNIWNERVNIAQDNYRMVRTIVLVRSEDLLSYALFEEENHRYATNEYEWRSNKNGNLIGISREDGKTKFTWQPHGAQFTIHTTVPAGAVKFTIKQPPLLPKEEVLSYINFNPSWIKIRR